MLRTNKGRTDGRADGRVNPYVPLLEGINIAWKLNHTLGNNFTNTHIHTPLLT